MIKEETELAAVQINSLQQTKVASQYTNGRITMCILPSVYNNHQETVSYHKPLVKSFLDAILATFSLKNDALNFR